MVDLVQWLQAVLCTQRHVCRHARDCVAYIDDVHGLLCLWPAWSSQIW